MYISESLLIIGLWLVGEKPSSHSLEAMLLSDRLCSIISVLAAMLPRPLVLFTLPTWLGRSSNFVFSPPAYDLSLFLRSNSSICLHAGGLTSCSGCHCLFIKFFGQVSSSQSFLRLAQHGVGMSCIKDRKRQLVVHHDRLLLCVDRFIPLSMRKLHNEFLSLDATIPYDEAELEDLNQFHSEAEEDIQGLFKLPNIPTNLDTDITPTPSPTPTPTNEELNIIDDVTTEEASSDSDSDAVVEEGDTDDISQASVEWTRRGRRIVRPSHLRDFILGDHD